MQPIIGILAGMGPRSTGPFLDLIVDECQRQYGARDDLDYPKMMICSQPAPFYEDRPIDHTALEAAIREGLQDLENAGADFLAIACNTAHIYYRDLAASVSGPLLNMVEIAASAIPGSARKAALIAARPTAESGVYQTAFRRRGVETIEIDWQENIDRLLGLTRTSTDPAVFACGWRALTDAALSAQADVIVVACLDLSGVIHHAQTTLQIFDAAQSLAREIVAEWLRRSGDGGAPGSSSDL
jgi:aspartate racemase